MCSEDVCACTHRDAYQGALSEEEMAALEQAAREKSQALSLIEAREKEIRDIRDGQLTSKKVRLVHVHKSVA